MTSGNKAQDEDPEKPHRVVGLLSRRIELRRRDFIALGAATGVGALLAIEGFAREPSDVELTVCDVRLPPGSGPRTPVKILQISDLHFRRFRSRERNLVALAKQADADIIVWTGDLIEKRFYAPGCMRLVAEVVGRTRSLAVQGNWEHWAGVAGKRIRKMLREVGVQLLINESAGVSVRGFPIQFVGVDDASVGYDSLPLALRNARKDEFSFLLSHAPVLLPEAAAERMDLVLAGHTHGGQICLPVIGALRLPPGSGKYVSGEYREGKTLMYVNRGIGTTIIPARLFCRPELTLFKLRT